MLDESILADLNEPQREAVAHRDGPLLVLAGPGSGKTRVITSRAAHLVRSGVAARNILAITFTNKAADEMKKRIEALGVARGMWVYTFHALGVRLLREFGPLGRVEPGFTIYDAADQKRLVKRAMEFCRISPDMAKPESLQAAISRAKNELRPPAELLEGGKWFEERMVGRVYEAYEQLLHEHNAVDFDDLLMRVALVLRGHAEITERLNIRFQYVLIDEYQDTNHAQYLIAKYLSKHHHNICATGDPDQSIYGWRGADLSNILEFEHDYPEAKIVRLEQNYRSCGAILKAASKLISSNARRKHKELWSKRPEGEPVRCVEFDTGGVEAEHIAETIERLHSGGRSYNDCAVFYRINALSRGIEESLRLRGIPYRVARGTEFYNRKEIKDTLAYLRVVVNPLDEISLLRIINTPPRGIGARTILRLRDHAAECGEPLMQTLRSAAQIPTLKKAAITRVAKFVEIIERIAAYAAGPVADAVSHALAIGGLEADLRRDLESGGEDRLANVQELVTGAKAYDDETESPSLQDFLHRVSLVSDQDAIDESQGVVLLMTLHAAKGLEFPIVFIAGLEQGILPHERSLRERGGADLEEERRLLFVGITRAMDELRLSHVRERYMRGSPMPRSVSQFVGELPDDAVVFESRRTHARSSRPAEHSDGFVPLDDQLGPDDIAPRRRAGRSPRSAFGDEPVFSPDDPTGRAIAAATDSPYRSWKAGTLLQHPRYGVGTLLWLRPSPGQTRAAIQFAGHGEKVFILERAPVSKLERGA